MNNNLTLLRTLRLWQYGAHRIATCIGQHVSPKHHTPASPTVGREQTDWLLPPLAPTTLPLLLVLSPTDSPTLPTHGFQPIQTVALTTASYLLGSIPFSYLVARTQGVDLRTVGSGNIGASNVWRSCGFGSFVAAMLLDAIKGLTMTYVAKNTLHMQPAAVVTIGAGAMLGHTFSLFMGFKGGKAVATTTGVLLAIFPQGVAVGAPVWGSIMATTRISSVSSLTAAAAVMATALLRLTQRTLDPVYAGFIITAGGAIFYLHRSNIQRLLSGTENRFQKLV
jgi:glycerol-3-phosphate acyltransferase PlsY